MSWLIDDLNNDNVKLRRELNTSRFKFNRLVKDYSGLITELDTLNSKMDSTEAKNADLEEQNERLRVMIKEFGQDVNALYPDFKSRLKFLLKG